MMRGFEKNLRGHLAAYIRIKQFRLQSAMEYLLTYGWALLIIAIVLAALFQLGIFNGSTLLGTSCVAAPGFLCSNPVLLTTGNVAFTIGQTTGSTLYNVALGCAATSLGNGLPNPSGAVVMLAPSGGVMSTNTMSPANTAVGLGQSLTSGQTLSISGLPCFGTTGTALPAGSAIGTAFSGRIWLNYTSLVGPVSVANPMLTQKIASLTIRVV